MRALQAIGDDLEALDALLGAVGGDVTEADARAAVDAWFAELGPESTEAVDRAVAWMRDLEVRAAAKRAAVLEYEQNARAEERRAEMVKGRLLDFVKRRGGRFRTTLHPLRIQRNSTRALTLLVDPEALPEEFRDEETVYTARKDEIRKQLEAGAELPFAVLEEPGFHLRIG